MTAECLQDRRGVALAVALFALVVIAALVSGSFFAGRLEQQSGRNSIYGIQAMEAAEAGLSDALVNLDIELVQSLPVAGLPLEIGTENPGVTLRVARQVVRLTSGVFLVRSIGTRLDADNGVMATRTVALLVQVLPATEALPARLAPISERAWIQL
jgi:hypothetical protein